MTKRGLAFHVHHNVLVDYCYNYDERVACIKSNDAPAEQELRLRLFHMIPADRLPLQLVESQAAYEKAQAACDKAWAAYVESQAAYDKAQAACEPEIQALHAELCPNCPWDGKTIFQRRSHDMKGGEW